MMVALLAFFKIILSEKAKKIDIRIEISRGIFRKISDNSEILFT